MKGGSIFCGGGSIFCVRGGAVWVWVLVCGSMDVSECGCGSICGWVGWAWEWGAAFRGGGKHLGIGGQYYLQRGQQIRLFEPQGWQQEKTYGGSPYKYGA